MKVYIIAPYSNNYLERVREAEELLQVLELNSYAPTVECIKSRNIAAINCIDKIANCQAVFLLDNWEDCNVARFQYSVAVELDKHIWFEDKKFEEVVDVTKLIRNIVDITCLPFSKWTTKSRTHEQFCARMLFVYHGTRLGLSNSDMGKLLRRTEGSIVYSRNSYYDEYKFNEQFRRIADKLQEKQNRDNNLPLNAK